MKVGKLQCKISQKKYQPKKTFQVKYDRRENTLKFLLKYVYLLIQLYH